jgi:putative flippase GtrA
MTATLVDSTPAAEHAAGTTVLDVVVPVFNEQADLVASVRRLHAAMQALPFPWRITIADNASTDETPRLAARVAAELTGVRVLRLTERGRGRALRAAWTSSDAKVLAYTDVDLSTDLSALLPLVAPLISGHSDLAIGTRLTRSSRVVRGPRREVTSRAYNLILRAFLRVRFSDAQCGFKAVRAEVAHALLPLVRDEEWFFDTEMLVLAERGGLRIHEVPVDWVDDPDSRVELLRTAQADLLGVLRLLRGFASGSLGTSLHERVTGLRRAAPSGMLSQLSRFATVGVVSTLAFLLLFLGLRPGLGAQGANLVALLVTALANTAANRRVTFGLRGSHSLVRHHAQGLGLFALGLGLTSGSLALLHLAGSPARWAEVSVLVLANATATLVRFVLLRRWVFRVHSPLGTPP